MLYFVTNRLRAAISEDVLLSTDELCLTPWYYMKWSETKPVSFKTCLTPGRSIEGRNTNSQVQNMPDSGA